jgi:hypothetical protein
MYDNYVERKHLPQNILTHKDLQLYMNDNYKKISESKYMNLQLVGLDKSKIYIEFWNDNFEKRENEIIHINYVKDLFKKRVKKYGYIPKNKDITKLSKRNFGIEINDMFIEGYALKSVNRYKNLNELMKDVDVEDNCNEIVDLYNKKYCDKFSNIKELRFYLKNIKKK